MSRAVLAHSKAREGQTLWPSLQGRRTGLGMGQALEELPRALRHPHPHPHPQLIPGVSEGLTFVPLFTLLSASHQCPSCQALCGSWGQGVSRPPNPLETLRLAGWESGAGPWLWVRVSLGPWAGPWAPGRRPLPWVSEGLCQVEKGQEGLVLWLECGEGRPGGQSSLLGTAEEPRLVQGPGGCGRSWGSFDRG